MKSFVVYVLTVAAIIVGGASFKGISMQSYLTYHLTAYLKMEDCAYDTIVTNEIGNTNGSAQHNTLGLSAPGKLGNCLYFDEDDFVDTNKTFKEELGSNFSLAFWFKVNVYSDWDQYALLHTGPGTSSYVQSELIPTEYYTGRSVLFEWTYLGGEQVYIKIPEDTYPPVISDGWNDWHFIIYTVYQSGSDLAAKIYFDSEELASFSIEGDMSLYDCNNTLKLGTPTEFDHKFVGYIDNVMLFDIAATKTIADWLWNGGEGREL